MQLTTITPSIFTIDDVFTREECNRYIQKTEAIGYEQATINTRQGKAMAKGVRNNYRVILDDHAEACGLWERIGHLIPARQGSEANSINERFRYYRYKEGQQFVWHRDGYHTCPNGDVSRLTLMVYLNDGFKGGETLFDLRDQIIRIKPKAGMALLFVHQLLHEGATISQGTKYVLRSDVIFDS